MGHVWIGDPQGKDQMTLWLHQAWVWDHHKLKVYGKALDAVEELENVAKAIRGRSDLRDQLRRASVSVVLNIAEGGSEYSLADKARFYRFARRSAAECSSILDVIARVQPGAPASSSAQERLGEVAAMLTALSKRTPERL